MDLVRGTFNDVDLQYLPLTSGRKNIHVHLIGACFVYLSV